MQYLNKIFNFVKLNPFEVDEDYFEKMDSFYDLLKSTSSENQDCQRIVKAINNIEEPEEIKEMEPIVNGQRDGDYFKSCKSVKI